MSTRQLFKSRLAPYLWRQWREELTPAGRYFMYGVGLSGLGSVTVQIPVYQVFCALSALLLIVGFAGVFIRPIVALEGRLPEKVTAGQRVTAEITVRNRIRRPIYDLALGFFRLSDSLRQMERERTVSCIPAKASVTVPVTLKPLRRGLYELPKLRAYSTFPFNLGRFGNSLLDLGSLLVLPDFHPLEGIDIPFGTRYQSGGIALTSSIGESPEYVGNREYVPGEPARRLDFRAWARLGKPVVREYQEEYYCRVALILDTFVPPKRKPVPSGFANLEAAVSLTASVADVLSNGEYLIDLFTAGPELHVFRAGRHTAHLENVLEILACVEASREDPVDAIIPAIADELQSISTTICLFLDWDDSRERLARVALEAGCALKTIILRDEETTKPIDSDEFGDVTQYRVADVRSGFLDRL